MNASHFDLIVIGGGSGGYAAARTAREVRERVAIVDAGTELGGLCILRGCMPSKTVIYSAEVLHHARHAGLFGLRIPEATADMPAVQARKRAMVEDFASYRRESLQSDRFSLFRERARFVDAQTIELQPSGQRLSADRFVISTGSANSVPPIPGLAEVPAWTSDEVLELDFLPAKVIVLGGGVIACELAQYLARMASRVVQIQRSPRILKEATPEASAVVEAAFRAEGIELYTGTQTTQVTFAEGTYRVHFTQGEQAHTVEAPHLVNALGRRPQVDGLNLTAAGVETRRSGHIIANEFLQSSQPHIYAAGDVTGPYEIVHLAVMQGEIAGRHATGRPAQPINYAHRTSVVFTDPQVATVGPLPSELDAADTPYLIADYPFNDHGKSILMHATYGHVRVWADPQSGRVLGAECVSKDAGELIHALAVGVSLRATVTQLLQTHWYHPTLAEIWSYPLEELAEAVGRQ